MNGDLDSPIKGSAVLTATQAADLLAGKWYVNLHTAINLAGEIRGQVDTAK
jgi:CHRD domain